MRQISSTLLFALAACERPQPLVLCHNANCAGDADPAADDTPAALRASLALRWEGRPAIDGVELDTMWHRPTGACLFEHGPGETLPPDTAADAAAIIAEHLAGDDVAWNGERFHVFIELKPYVANRSDVHTAAERDLHADCALDVFDALVAAAAGRHRLQVIFETVEPDLLAALAARPRWPGRTDGDVEVRVAGEPAVLLDPFVTGSATSRYPMALDAFLYTSDATEAHLRSLADLGLDLCLWQYTFTPAMTAAVRRDEPRYVLAGEALLLRRWLED